MNESISAIKDLLKVIIGIPSDLIMWIGGLFSAFLAGEYGCQAMRAIVDPNGWHKDAGTCFGIVAAYYGILAFILLMAYLKSRDAVFFLLTPRSADMALGVATIIHALSASFYNVSGIITSLTHGKAMLVIGYIVCEALMLMMYAVVMYFAKKVAEQATRKRKQV